jgi:uncharacterized protein
MLNLPITLVTAGISGLLFFLLSLHVVRGRMATKVSLGDGGDPTLITRIRTHGNFAEYMPLALLLLALCEISNANRQVLVTAGAVLVLARLSHAIGMPRPAPNLYRIFGMAGTWATIILLSALALLLGLGVV